MLERFNARDSLSIVSAMCQYFLSPFCVVLNADRFCSMRAMGNAYASFRSMHPRTKYPSPTDCMNSSHLGCKAYQYGWYSRLYRFDIAQVIPSLLVESEKFVR